MSKTGDKQDRRQETIDDNVVMDERMHSWNGEWLERYMDNGEKKHDKKYRKRGEQEVVRNNM